MMTLHLVSATPSPGCCLQVSAQSPVVVTVVTSSPATWLASTHPSSSVSHSPEELVVLVELQSSYRQYTLGMKTIIHYHTTTWRTEDSQT